LRVTQVARSLNFSGSSDTGHVTLTVDACPEVFALQADDAVKGQLNLINALSW
jgi:hypothetical protein